jgi:acyl dehydratase
MNAALPADGTFHHEDLTPGRAFAFGHYTVTRDEIIAYARAYDPQPMHVDEEAAKTTIVGGLCAAGYHTCALMMRVLYDGFIKMSTSLGSPGMDEVRWLKPVRPGDTLSLRMTVMSARNLRSRPDVGISAISYEMLNQHGDVVLTCTSKQMLRRRTPADPSTIEAPATETRPPTPLDLWAEDGPPPSRVSMYAEDRIIGETMDLGSHTFTADEIIAFARQFDPQPFHLSEEEGRKSLFGGLSASGWHTCAIYIRHVIAERAAVASAIRAAGRPLAQYGPSPGFRDLRWIKPVLAGDTLEFRMRLIDKRDLASRPDRALLISRTQGRNQRGTIVFDVIGQVFAEKRG